MRPRWLAFSLTIALVAAWVSLSPVSGPAPIAATTSCVARTGPIRLWPLGDSLTVGGYGDPVGFTDSYRYELWRVLQTDKKQPPTLFRGAHGLPYPGGYGWGGIPPAGSGLTEFSHSGLGGYTVAQIRDGVSEWLPIADPDLIVVNIGTNGGTPTQYRELVARLRAGAPNAAIVLGTLTLIRSEVEGGTMSTDRITLNAEIRRIGSESSNDLVVTADVAERMRASMKAEDFSDSVHLAISGGNKFAAALLPEVLAVLPRLEANRCARSDRVSSIVATTRSTSRTTTKAKKTTTTTKKKKTQTQKKRSTTRPKTQT